MKEVFPDSMIVDDIRRANDMGYLQSYSKAGEH